MNYSLSQRAMLRLSFVKGIGPKRMEALLSLVDDAQEIFSLPEQDLARATTLKIAAAIRASSAAQAEDIIADMQRQGIRAIFSGEAGYPRALLDLPTPPAVLYLKGPGRLDSPMRFGIVGARACTHYGVTMAGALARGLAEQGVCIVSGMARGIDSHAHLGACKAEGGTIAVLGCGLDICYPPENGELYDTIAQTGLLVSEYAPGVKPFQGNFVARNRIIAALSDGVLLVEGEEGSGALQTVQIAAELGRTIFALPGHVTSLLSVAPNRLLREGAHIVLEKDDIIENMGWTTSKARAAAPAGSGAQPLDAQEQMVYDLLRMQDMTFQALCENISMDTAKLSSLLTRMVLRSIIKQYPGKVYSIT